MMATALKFKVGDRVKVKDSGFQGYSYLAGKTGIIRQVNSIIFGYGVEFDESFAGGHTLGVHDYPPKCRWCTEDELIPESEWDE